MPHATSPLPSLDALLRQPEGGVLLERFGRQPVTQALRDVLAARRTARVFGAAPAAILDAAADLLARRAVASQRPVFNLTGTVLHTNLGRAPLPPEAAEAAAEALRCATTLEYDLDTGRRGERDDHVGAAAVRTDRRRGRHRGQQQRRRRAAGAERVRRSAARCWSRAAS